MTDQPILDPEAIEQLRAINPDDGGEFLRELITIFLTDTPGRLQEIRTTLASGDAVTLTRAAHSIKGSAGNFGATTLAALAYEIEQAGKKGALGDIGAMIPGLETEFGRVKQALEQILA